jgi:hypothetical protein
MAFLTAAWHYNAVGSPDVCDGININGENGKNC